MLCHIFLFFSILGAGNHFFPFCTPHSCHPGPGGKHGSSRAAPQTHHTDLSSATCTFLVTGILGPDAPPLGFPQGKAQVLLILEFPHLPKGGALRAHRHLRPLMFPGFTPLSLTQKLPEYLRLKSQTSAMSSLPGS